MSKMNITILSANQISEHRISYLQLFHYHQDLHNYNRLASVVAPFAGILDDAKNIRCKVTEIYLMEPP